MMCHVRKQKSSYAGSMNMTVCLASPVSISEYNIPSLECSRTGDVQHAADKSAEIVWCIPINVDHNFKDIFPASLESMQWRATKVVLMEKGILSSSVPKFWKCDYKSVLRGSMKFIWQ